MPPRATGRSDHHRAPRPACRPRVVASSLRALGPAQRVAHLGTAGAHSRGPGLPHSSSPPFPLPVGPGMAPSARKPHVGETAAGRLRDGTQSHRVFVSTRRLTPCWTWSRPRGLGSGRLRAGTTPHQDLPRRPDRPLKRHSWRGEPDGPSPSWKQKGCNHLFIHLRQNPASCLAWKCSVDFIYL